MRAEAIADFSYDPKASSALAQSAAIRAPGASTDPVDPAVVVMDPVIVKADRGLSPKQFRALDSAFQQQAKVASEPKIPFMKVHEFKLSRKVNFGYVTILGVPVAGGFSW